jgi:hypothetical protein
MSKDMSKDLLGTDLTKQDKVPRIGDENIDSSYGLSERPSGFEDKNEEQN